MAWDGVVPLGGSSNECGSTKDSGGDSVDCLDVCCEGSGGGFGGVLTASWWVVVGKG